MLRVLVLAVVFTLLSLEPGWSADYTGPLIDAHSHVPNATAIDAYVAAMKRHNVVKVVLLGVGGVQKDDPAWLRAASQKHPDRVVAGLPLADPMSEGAASQLNERVADSGVGAVGQRRTGAIGYPQAKSLVRVDDLTRHHRQCAKGHGLTVHPGANIEDVRTIVDLPAVR